MIHRRQILQLLLLLPLAIAIFTPRRDTSSAPPEARIASISLQRISREKQPDMHLEIIQFYYDIVEAGFIISAGLIVLFGLTVSIAGMPQTVEHD